MSTSESKPSPPASGRPRSADATDAVLQAALDLAQQAGMPNATVERIARQSGVAKTTIYRRWPNAAAIVMDAFLKEMSPQILYHPKPTVQETLAASITQLAHVLQGPRGQLLRHLLGAAQGDPDVQAAFLQRWVGPRRAQAKVLLAQARKTGEVRAQADDEVLIDSLYGAVYYRLMMPYAELSPAYIQALVAQVFDGATDRAAPIAAAQPQVGVGVLIIRDGRILLGKRAGSHGAGTWALAGGHLEFGESIETCARREVLEETGLTLDRILPAPSTNDIMADERKHYVTCFVEASISGNEPARILEPGKCLAWEWFRWTDLPEPLFEPVKTLARTGYVPTLLNPLP